MKLLNHNLRVLKHMIRLINKLDTIALVLIII